MRLLKAEFKKITFALFVILFALILVQCIFVVDGVAAAESPAYRELISDYFSFYAPTRIAACGEYLAVFDEGDVHLFRNGAHTLSFDAETDVCDKLVLATDGVFLLTGLSNDAPIIRAYSFDGSEKGYVIPSDSVTDISYANGKLYTLGGLLNVNGYATADGALAESYDLQGMSFSVRLAADESVTYFRKYDGTILKKDGEGFTSLENVGEVTELSACGGALYYAKDNEIRLLGQTSRVLPAVTSGDAAFDVVTDFVVGSEIYVLDKESKAVKVYALNGTYQKMIGAAGDAPGRLKAPVALAVKGEKLYVADSLRGSEYSPAGVHVLNGRSVVAPRDIAATDTAVYLADNGTLYEYGSAPTPKDYPFPSDCHFVAALPGGTVYASSGRNIYEKKADVSAFSPSAIVADGTIDGMTVGIGGNTLYLMTGNRISAYYVENGVKIASLTTNLAVKGFAVDYRGNLYLVAGKKLYRYERVLNEYASTPEAYDLPVGYEDFSDLAFDSEGNAYLIADHNVLIYPKEAFSVCIKEGDFTDDVPAEHPIFICEVVSDTAIAYVSPGNFEEISVLGKGERLMCDARVSFGGSEYYRAKTKQGKVYLAVGDAKRYAASAEPPFRKARCLIPAIGEPRGVNIYVEPDEEGEILFASLGREVIFDVIAYVAVDENGADVWNYLLVSYEGKEGYVNFDDVVSTDADPAPMPKTVDMQAKSDGLGKTVAIYREASLDSEVVGTFTDGSTIRVIVPFDPESDFTAILYKINNKDEICYVLSANVGQNGLSAGQILAIVLSVVAVIGSVLTVLILRANKKHKRRQKE